MDATELILLYDYYGALLTQRQQECFELRYNQDLSLGEIGQELGISRQGVFDNLSRAEALLKNMEAKTGCVRRDRACRKAIDDIRVAAGMLCKHSDDSVVLLAQQIRDAADAVEE